jgi:hypothetical protein
LEIERGEQVEVTVAASRPQAAHAGKFGFSRVRVKIEELAARLNARIAELEARLIEQEPRIG